MIEVNLNRTKLRKEAQLTLILEYFLHSLNTKRVNFANFANFAKLTVKSFAFREILKKQKISNTRAELSSLKYGKFFQNVVLGIV